MTKQTNSKQIARVDFYLSGSAAYVRLLTKWWNPDKLFQLWLFNELDEDSSVRLDQHLEDMIDVVASKETKLTKRLKRNVNKYYRENPEQKRRIKFWREYNKHPTASMFDTAAKELNKELKVAIEEKYDEVFEAELELAAKELNEEFGLNNTLHPEEQVSAPEEAFSEGLKKQREIGNLQYSLLDRISDRLHQKPKSDEEYFTVALSKNISKIATAQTTSKQKYEYINEAWIEFTETLENADDFIQALETAFLDRIYSKIKQKVVSRYIEKFEKDLRTKQPPLATDEVKKLVKKEKRKIDPDRLLQLSKKFPLVGNEFQDIVDEAYKYVYEGSLKSLLFRIMQKHLSRDKYYEKKQHQNKEIDSVLGLASSNNTEEVGTRKIKSCDEVEVDTEEPKELTLYEIYQSNMDPDFNAKVDAMCKTLEEKARTPESAEAYKTILFGLMKKQSNVEIAKQLGIDKSKITTRRKQMAKYLAEYRPVED